VASNDWVPDESDREWLPAVDVREVVGTLPPGSVNIEDPAWDVLPGSETLREIRAIVRGLGDADVAVVEKSLERLWWFACSDGNTTVAGALVVPSLIRAPAHVGPRRRAEMLQLAGHMARVDTLYQEVRPGLLRTMQPRPVYDSSGYLENWSVEAVRAMVGRDGDLLTALMQDDSPEVRGRAAYVLAAAKPVNFDVIDVMRARLAVESDPAVQMILVLCVAQIEKDRDRTAEASSWARSLWSNPDASLGVRLGGVIAWLGLTPADPSLPELQALLATMPMPVVGQLLRELPWIWSLSNREGRVAHWWQNLQIPYPPDDEF
jgi:hypothetical protein